MRWVGVYEFTCPSTLSWKEEELLPRVPCYSKSQQIKPCKQRIAQGKHSLFPRSCLAANMQAGKPIFPGCQPLALVLMPPGSPVSHFSNPFFPKVPLFPKSLQSLLGGLASSTGTSAQGCWEPSEPQWAHVATTLLQRGEHDAGTLCRVLIHQAGTYC